MKCLFVGGDYDGEMIDVNERLECVAMQAKIKAPFPIIANQKTTHAFSWQSYKRERFIDADGLEYVMYLCGNVAQPMRMIIEGYAKLRAQAGSRKGGA